MKTLLAAVLSLFVLSGYCQTVNKRTITIGGAVLNDTCTYARFTAIMGAPDSRKSEQEDGGELITMLYNNNTFYLHANVFNCFQLVNNSYKLNGVVGVGDPVANIDLLKPFKLISKPNGAGKELYYAYITDAYLIDPDWDRSPIYFYVTNGIITKISYLYMDNI